MCSGCFALELDPVELHTVARIPSVRQRYIAVPLSRPLYVQVKFRVFLINLHTM